MTEEKQEIKEIDSIARTSSKESNIRKGKRFDLTTWSSKHFVDDYIKDIGTVERVDLCGGGVGINGSVVIIGSNGTLRPQGFGIGYSGTGARGLVDTLSKIEIDSKENLEKVIFDKENYYKCITLHSKKK